MPDRKELAADTIIYETNLMQIKVGKVKGRGGSAIVYEGQKISNGKSEYCLVKEVFPLNKGVFRDENGTILTKDEAGKDLYQRVLSACKSEVDNHAKLVGYDAPRSDIMLRASEYISPETSTNGNAYMILDTVECKTLADIKRSSVYEACRYIEKLLAAVSYIHQKGALHLDIAPDNVIIAETTDVVRLIDFNSSCFKDEKTNLYHSGSSKKGYSASEVCDGFSPNICAASDLFSVAAVLYTMIFNELYEDKDISLRRQKPVVGRKVTEKLNNIISKPAQRLLAEILCKGLAHYASDRYQTAEEMLAVIEKLTELTAPAVVYPLDFSAHTRSLLPSFCQKRDSMLDAVHRELEEHNHVFVGGIGGSGKSALSSMFVNKFSSEYDAVQTIIFTSCKDVIKSVGFAGISDSDSYYKEHPDDLYAAKLYALQTKTDSRTLLIIENYTKRKDDCYDDLMTCPCRIIFNTRSTINNDDFLPLEDISEEEALEYFLTVSERVNETETIKEIIPFTGRNFLLMKLLALKLRNSPNVTAEFVLNKLRSNERFDKGRFTFDKFNEETQEEILHEVFSISNLLPEETELLSSMTLVPYCGIKQTDFEQALALDIEENPVDGLVRLGWITRTDEGTAVKLSLHQTISDFFARSDKTKPDFDKFAPLLEKMCEIFDIDNAGTLDERESVLSVSDFFARRVTGDNLACAAIYDLIGHNYSDNGDYCKALEYHNAAHKIRVSVLGENNADTAASYIDIGNAYFDLGDIDKALENYNKTDIIFQSGSGEKHPDKAISFNDIFHAFSGFGNWDKVLEYCNMVLEEALSVFGENHPYTALSYDNFGGAYCGLHEYKKALEYYNKALEIRLSIFGENHHHTAESYIHIGSAYSGLRDYKMALENYNTALKIYQSVLGENHPDTATCYNSIGCTYRSLNDWNNALEFCSKALDIRLSVLGEKHPDTAQSYYDISFVYCFLGECSKALESCNKALNIFLPVFVKKHPVVKKCRKSIKIIKLVNRIRKIISSLFR